MTSTPKSGKYAQETDSPSSSPLAGSEPGGHKASFRSTKLAKRARSFKDDVLEKISQMRSPTNQGPKGRQVKRVEASDHHHHNKGGPIDELELQFRQLQLALKHFRGVVAKKTLQMLPGNGTIVLDTIWAINLIVQRTMGVSDKTKSIKVATQRMYHSVGKVIKLCDDALIDEKCPALEEENVDEVISQMEDSVKALIKEVEEKICHQPTSTYMSAPRPSHSNLEAPAQRNSLPDIPLTPKDLEKLEDSSCPSKVVRSSHSTESILRDSSPPPKPPLPRGMYSKDTGTALTPPPLPPKKKNSDNFGTFFNSDSSIFHNSFERMSLISRSPEDSFSMLSASAVSLDSMLNNSREEEEDEITAIMDPSTDNESLLESDLSGITSANGVTLWHDDVQNTSQALQLNDTNNFHLHRLSNTDSGFMSVQSQRSSSYSKRSSQQSVVSTHWTSQQCFSSAKQAAMEADKSSSSDSQVTIASVKTMSSHSSSNKLVSECNSSYTSVDECDNVKTGPDPPPIPQKMRRRQPSPYDNVPDNNIGGELLVTCQMHQSHSRSSNTSMISAEDNGQPPPLPLKKRHIMAYMEMFGNCSHSTDNEFLRHSVHVQGQWSQMPKPGLPTTQSCSFSHTSSHSSSLYRSTHSQIQTLTIPHNSGDSSPIPSPIRSPNLSISPVPSLTPPALPPKRSRSSSAKTSPPVTPQALPEKPPVKSLPDLLEHTSAVPKEVEEAPVLAEVKPCDIDLMEKTEITQYLVFKNGEDEGPDIRGGCIDALIIQATKATKNGVFAYQEAFLTTYRTFITPINLITKLIRRFKHFYPHPDKKPEKKKEAFALLIRVVSDLTPLDLDSKIQEMLMDFVQLLISYGEITLAKALRVKHLDRHNLKIAKPVVTEPIAATVCNTSTPKNVPCTLLDFKSEQIAEQMTFLDAELFMKIEIPEVLIWAEEQNEERSPNLTRFTEHFNKVSYWARTKILLAEAKDREKYCVKFIKIMKHLRKINNFNSYLALLSALDSAPIRRLEWQRHIQDGLKEYCALIDSSSSFRAYRMALADAQPPCIPYIGLVLQDLTFVHIGNSNLLQNGLINFSKRWQQYNIVENMKRFKKCSYMFKKNEKITDFFQNFDEYITEDEMWAKSESIKPRGTRKAQ